MNTIPFYNPNQSAAKNELMDDSLYYFDRYYLNNIIGISDSSHYNIYAGRMPEAAWEICLPSIYAESILEYGAYPLQTERMFSVPTNLYEISDVVAISSVEDMIGKELIIKNSGNESSAKFKIVGFYQSSINNYKWLKDVTDINGASEKEKARIESNVNALNSMKQNGMGLVSKEFLKDFIKEGVEQDFAISQTHYLDYAGQSYVVKSTNNVGDIEYAQGKSAENALRCDIVIPRALAEANKLEFGSSIFMNLNSGNSIEKINFKVIGYHETDVLPSRVFINEISGGDKLRVYNNFVFKDFDSKEYKAFHKYITRIMNIEDTALEYSTASSYMLDEVMKTFDDIRYYIFLPLILIAFALTIVFISALVSDFTAMKATDIGTLRAIGLRKREVYKIFILAVGWQLIFELVLAMLIGGIAFLLINSILINTLGIFVNVLFMNLATVLVTLLAVMAIIPLGILLPVRNTNRKTPQSLMNR